MATIWLCIMTGLLALPNGAAAQDEPASRPATGLLDCSPIQYNFF